MRGSIVGSGVIHLLILVALFYARAPISLVVPGPETVQVALVDPGTLAPTPPPPAVEPPPQPKVESVKPEEDTGVKLAPEPPKKKKKPEPPREEPPPPQQLPTLPAEKLGSAGLRGDL